MKLSWFRQFSTSQVGVCLTGFAIIVASFTMFFLGARSGYAHPQAAAKIPISWNYKYDVVSVKPTGSKADTGGDGYGSNKLPDGLRITGATLRALIIFAYKSNPDSSMGVSIAWRRDQILGLPEWAASDTFSIDARMDPSVMGAVSKLNTNESQAARDEMLRALLAEYFKLAVRTETRQLPVYFLLIAKGGVKFNESPVGEESRFMIMPGGGGSRKIACKACSLDLIIGALSVGAGRQVLNRTGLAKRYDFELQWMPDNGSVAAASAVAESSWPPVGKALEEQLGLKLESGRGPVPVLLIDHVERPSAN